MVEDDRLVVASNKNNDTYDDMGTNNNSLFDLSVLESLEEEIEQIRHLVGDSAGNHALKRRNNHDDFEESSHHTGRDCEDDDDNCNEFYYDSSDEDDDDDDPDSGEQELSTMMDHLVAELREEIQLEKEEQQQFELDQDKKHWLHHDNDENTLTGFASAHSTNENVTTTSKITERKKGLRQEVQSLLRRISYINNQNTLGAVEDVAFEKMSPIVRPCDADYSPVADYSNCNKSTYETVTLPGPEDPDYVPVADYSHTDCATISAQEAVQTPTKQPASDDKSIPLSPLPAMERTGVSSNDEEVEDATSDRRTLLKQQQQQQQQNRKKSTTLVTPVNSRKKQARQKWQNNKKRKNRRKNRNGSTQQQQQTGNNDNYYGQDNLQRLQEKLEFLEHLLSTGIFSTTTAGGIK